MACRAGKKKLFSPSDRQPALPHFLRHCVSSYVTWPQVGKVGSLRVIYKLHMWAFSCTVAVAKSVLASASNFHFLRTSCGDSSGVLTTDSNRIAAASTPQYTRHKILLREQQQQAGFICPQFQVLLKTNKKSFFFRSICQLT